jgi:hypothetical protein
MPVARLNRSTPWVENRRDQVGRTFSQKNQAPGSEIQTTDDYTSLIELKKGLLSDRSLGAPDKYTLRGRLLTLYRMNSIQAEAILYKDYIRSYVVEEGGMRVKDWKKIQQHLDRFCML